MFFCIENYELCYKIDMGETIDRLLCFCYGKHLLLCNSINNIDIYCIKNTKKFICDIGSEIKI